MVRIHGAHDMMGRETLNQGQEASSLEGHFARVYIPGLRKENCISPGNWSSLLPQQGQGVKEAKVEKKGAMRQACLAAPRVASWDTCSASPEPFPQPACPMLPSLLHTTDCSPSQATQHGLQDFSSPTGD